MKTRITELLDIQFPIIQGGMAWVAEHHLAAAVSDAGGLGIIGAGADAVVAEGMESGGHIGAQTTMCLVPQVVDAVQIPVIVAGGIADGRGGWLQHLCLVLRQYRWEPDLLSAGNPLFMQTIRIRFLRQRISTQK